MRRASGWLSVRFLCQPRQQKEKHIKRNPHKKKSPPAPSGSAPTPRAPPAPRWSALRWHAAPWGRASGFLFSQDSGVAPGCMWLLLTRTYIPVAGRCFFLLCVAVTVALGLPSRPVSCLSPTVTFLRAIRRALHSRARFSRQEPYHARSRNPSALALPALLRPPPLSQRHAGPPCSHAALRALHHVRVNQTRAPSRTRQRPHQTRRL